jgi:hypothetical protein
LLDDDAVLSDRYLVDRRDRALGRQERNLQLQQRQFIRMHRRKARIGIRDRSAKMDKGGAKRGIRRQSTKTSAQLIALVDRDECAAPQRKRTNADDLWRTMACDARLERLPGNCEKRFFVSLADHSRTLFPLA